MKRRPAPSADGAPNQRLEPSLRVSDEGLGWEGSSPGVTPITGYGMTTWRMTIRLRAEARWAASRSARVAGGEKSCGTRMVRKRMGARRARRRSHHDCDASVGCAGDLADEPRRY